MCIQRHSRSISTIIAFILFASTSLAGCSATSTNAINNTVLGHTHPITSTSPSTTKRSATKRTTQKQSEPAVKTVSDGQLVLIGENGSQVELPLICIAATYGVSGPGYPPSITPRLSLSPVNFTVPLSQRNKLSAYWVDSYDGVHGLLFLGPRNWTVVSAGVGADGSEGVELVNPQDAKQILTVGDDGGCQGCTASAIVGTFPNMMTWGKQQEPGDMPYAPPPHYLGYSLINTNTLAYSIHSAGNPYVTNGVAFKHSTGMLFFGREEINMPASEHALETTMLNFYAEREATTVTW